MHQQHDSTNTTSPDASLQTIFVIGSVLKWLASLAGSLKPAEFRLLLHLAAHAEPPEFTLRQSSREIAAQLGMARSAVVRAIDSLTANGYIAARQGTGTTAAGYMVNALKTIPISGPFRGPLAVEKVVLQKDLVLSEDHSSGPFGGPLSAASGPFGGPPPSKERAGARVDSTDQISDTIDRSLKQQANEEPIKTGNPEWDAIIARVLRARPADYSADQLADAKRWVHGYHAKMRGDGPHPPDPHILAPILAAIDPWTPEILWRELMDDSPRPRPGDKYGWYVAVALQRRHGIPPAVFAQARAQLRAIQGGKQPDPATETETRQLVKRAIATIAGRSMR